MWKQLKISNKTYFILCSIKADEMICILYDSNDESWCESTKLSVIFERVKQLNKRIQFGEPTIRDTLKNSAAEEATWEENGDVLEKTLKLKYRVSTRPFNFIWNLRKQTPQEFKKFIVNPLFKVIQALVEQNLKLRESVEKKDNEISQYKREGFLLRRTTVATKPFDFEKFDEKYIAINDLSRSLQLISDHMQAQADLEDASKPLETETVSGSALNVKMEDGAKCETSETSETTKSDHLKLKVSPRNRKRKALEAKQRHLKDKLQATKQKLNYVNSQSQSLSQELSSSQSSTEKDLPSTSATLEPQVSQELKVIQEALKSLEERRLADMKLRKINIP